MGKQENLHVVYTLQIKAKATKSMGQEQVDDLIDSIRDTLDNWFPAPKSTVELERHDVSDGTKRVVITNVLPTVQRRPAGYHVIAPPDKLYRYGVTAKGIVDVVMGGPEAQTAARADGIVVGQQVPVKRGMEPGTIMASNKGGGEVSDQAS